LPGRQRFTGLPVEDRDVSLRRIFVQGSAVTKNLFTGKEQDSETGWDYFGGRSYNSALGRWLAVDPLGKKYPDLSPYNYTFNNPINAFDPDGKDVVVLINPDQAFWQGHTAVLISSKNGGWEFFSKNGGQGFASGPSNNPNLGKETKNYYKTLNDFAEFNLEKSEDNQYKEAILISADSDQDAAMREAAYKSSKSYFCALGASCIDQTSDVLRAGGFNGGTDLVQGNFGNPHAITSPIPNERFKAIKRNNAHTNVTNRIRQRSLPTTQQMMRSVLGIGKSVTEQIHDMLNND